MYFPLDNSLSDTRIYLPKSQEMRACTREDFGEAGSESESVQWQPVFEIENRALHYIYAAENNQQIAASQRAPYVSVDEIDTPSSQTEAFWEELLGHRNCKGYGKVVTNRTYWTDSMKVIQRIPPKRRLSNRSADSLGRSMLQRMDQKSVEWMKDLLLKFCKAEELMLNTCADTLGTSRAC